MLGLVNYYANFIPHISTVLSPLTMLLRKGMPEKIRWNEECQKAISCIQRSLTSHPVLCLPDFSQPFFLQTDASSVGLGGALLQMKGTTLHPCLFVARKLLPRETNYGISELECLAIIYSVTKLQRYLMGRKFIILSDHRPLLCLKNSMGLKGRLARWALALQEFDFDISHIKGTNNFLADFLSRNF